MAQLPRANGACTPPTVWDTRLMCGVFGVWAPGEEVSNLTYFGLHTLQHRGHESAGIATSDGQRILVFKDMGLVTQVFDESALESLRGHIAVGHTRYSTAGSTTWENAQPILGPTDSGTIALTHNGNLTNTGALLRLVAERYGPKRAGELARGNTADTALITALLEGDPGHNLEETVLEVLPHLRGAFSLVFMDESTLYAARDPYGVRPLVLGRLERGWVVASETPALDIIGASYVRDVAPGELLIINEAGLRSHPRACAVQEPALPSGPTTAIEIGALPSGPTTDLAPTESLSSGPTTVAEFGPTHTPNPTPTRAGCVFEHVYLARPDTQIDGQAVISSRLEMGRRLAHEHPVEADFVMPTPDSGTPAAVGYAEASGLPFQQGLTKNAYVGRTFIQPTDTLRQQGIRLKLNPVRELISGQRIVVVDDSIVRGNTQRALVRMLREAGAAEVHVRISSPPVVWPCFYGIDFASRAELIGGSLQVNEVCESIGADSLGYISLNGMIAATGRAANELCTACFTGDYPIEIPEHLADSGSTPLFGSELVGDAL
ncbi:MAG: amidophosphoribosyltransferase [Cellulomonadaceae bacterium]|nr:amidophosphoribosyltransferase [Cellulomonadaceae bacterium]